MPKTINALVLGTLLATPLMITPGNEALAATVNTVACFGGSGTCVTSISDLAVAGVGTFDISFSFFQNSASSLEPTYFGSDTQAVRDAIVAELFAQPATQADQIQSGGGDVHRSFQVADQLAAGNFTAYAGLYNQTDNKWQSGTNAGNVPSSDSTNWVIANEVAAVPLPAALPLLLSALGVFGFFGWRRKKAVA